MVTIVVAGHALVFVYAIACFGITADCNETSSASAAISTDKVFAIGVGVTLMNSVGTFVTIGAFGRIFRICDVFVSVRTVTLVSALCIFTSARAVEPWTCVGTRLTLVDV